MYVRPKKVLENILWMGISQVLKQVDWGAGLKVWIHVLGRGLNILLKVWTHFHHVIGFNTLWPKENWSKVLETTTNLFLCAFFFLHYLKLWKKCLFTILKRMKYYYWKRNLNIYVWCRAVRHGGKCYPIYFLWFTFLIVLLLTDKVMMKVNDLRKIWGVK